MKKPEFSRRKFLKTTGAVGAASALAACLPQHDPYSLAVEKPVVPGSDGWYRGEEKTLSTACGQCPVNCGIRVRVVEGRAVKINGNPDSLLVGGKLGPKGQTGLYTLYDPDRIKTPLKRDGERGSGKWKPITWKEAIAETSSKLSALREKSEPHKLAILCGRQRGFMKELLERFSQSFGTPNFFDPLSSGDGALVQAMELMTGVAEMQGYDADKTSYILSLGSGIFESTCNGIHFARSTGKFRSGNPTRRSKIVQVEPYRSQSAKIADEWIAIKPGTYDALALGIAHQLIKANLHDLDFVASQCSGFDSFAASLSDYPVEKVSEITGISEKNIYRLAWELAASKPAVVVVDSRSTSTSNGLEIARCALALNALLGSIERPGGIVLKKPIPLADWDAATLDDIAKKGLAQPSLDGRDKERFPLGHNVVEAFPESVMEGKPYGAEALLLYYSNPLFSRNNPDRYRKAFEKIPFIVSFSPFLDESAAYADLILPDHTYLERWEDATPPPFGFQAAIGMRRPVVEPLYETKNTGDALIQIAKGLDGTVAEAFPWKSFKVAMEERLAGVASVQRGTLSEESPEDFLKKLAKVGYWHDEPMAAENWKAAFKTPSGKFEFHSKIAEEKITTLARNLNHAPEQWLKNIGKPSLAAVCLPHAEAAVFAGSREEFPILFMTYKPITYAEGSGANIPHLREMAGLQRGLRAHESWLSWVDLNPETARKIGVVHGEKIWLESPIGRIESHALVTEAVPVDMAVMELGGGHKEFGRFARGKRSNPKELVPPHIDPLSGLTPSCGTRIRILKA